MLFDYSIVPYTLIMFPLSSRSATNRRVQIISSISIYFFLILKGAFFSISSQAINHDLCLLHAISHNSCFITSTGDFLFVNFG